MNYKLNRCLLTRDEVNQATNILNAEGLIPHGLSCKDPEVLIVAKNLGNGNICDLGADGSWTLPNAVKMGLTGEKHGIDFIIPEKDYGEIVMTKGDLMNTPYPDNHFDFVTCMSVVEHNCSFEAVAKECNRIMKAGAKLIMSTDYWNPAPDTSHVQLYGLPWNILDTTAVLQLVAEMKKVGLNLTSEIDFTTQEAVINPQFCSPSNVAYTFIFLEFIKN